MLWKITEDGSVKVIQIEDEHSYAAMPARFLFFRESKKAQQESVMVFTSQPKILLIVALKSETSSQDKQSF